MKILTAVLTFALVAGSQGALGKSRCDKYECHEIKSQIREIQAKMRTGYSAAQGVRYDAKLRQLRSRRAKYCR